jgi:nucleoside-triphosphatase THEP1
MNREKSASYRPYLILSLGFGAMLVLMSVLAYLGITYLQAAQQRLDMIVVDHMKKIDLSTHMRRSARERTISLQNMIIMTDPFERDDQWMLFKKHAADFIEERNALLSMQLSNREKQLINKQGQLPILPYLSRSRSSG